MNNPQVDPNTMMTIVLDYIEERTGEKFNPGPIQLDAYGFMVLNDMFWDVINWNRIKHNIIEVLDKQGQRVKIF